MDPKDARQKLNIFVDTLPDSAFIPLRDKDINPSLLTTDIASSYEFVIRETGHICEGVRRVLAGEDSASNFVAFIQQDPNIEEDNRPKLPELAFEIQQKIFDPVLPILRHAGLPIKEGRVAAPVPKAQEKFEVANSKFEGETTPAVSEYGTPFGKGETTSAISASFELNAKRLSAEALAQAGYPLDASPLEEKNIRALMRIAAGTTYSEQNLRDAFEDLPPGLRQSLSSVDTANAIQEIAKKYFLHVDQMASLASETGLVLLGLTHPADFIKNLSRRLRLAEDAARDIAREISAEIFVKVREALRNLHENARISNLESRISKNETEKSQNIKLENTESSRRIEAASTAKQSSSSIQRTSSELNAKRLPADSSVGLKASLQTPYSAGAKWNTGENILRRQAAEKEAPLSREEVLRDVENPRELNAKRYPPTGGLDTSPVGPTGWRPEQNEVRSMNYELGKRTTPAVSEYGTPFGKGETTSAVSEYGTPFGKGDAAQFPPSRPPSPIPPAIKSRPSDAGNAPTPEKPAGEPQDFFEEKLQRPVVMPKVEKRYTSDPYREPLQ